MIKKIISIYLLALGVTILSSCEKILDKDPRDQLSIDDTFADIDGAKAALAGAYRAMLSQEYYHRNRLIYPDLVGGNVKYSKSVNTVLSDSYNLATDPEETGSSTMNSLYIQVYAILNNINNIIERTPLIKSSQAEKNRVLAEAKALRALLHHDLLLCYAQNYTYSQNGSHLGIVVNLSPRLIEDPAPYRSSVAESYEAIEADLKESLALFDQSGKGLVGGNPKNYMSRMAVQALLARVYLHWGKWQQAYNAAESVIGSGDYSLISNQNYVASWTQNHNAASIFELAIPPDFAGSSYGEVFNENSTYKMMAATEDLLNLYTPGDVRGRISLYQKQTINNVEYYFCQKYPFTGASATNLKVFRLPELYLIRAEAAAELKLFDQANKDLKTIRQTADASYVHTELLDKSQLVDAILLERRKELAFEGFLLFDLARRHQNVSRQDCSGNFCTMTYPNDKYVLPIPRQSVINNPLMVPNPGY